MGFHPANLVLRFFLELGALYALGVWGWTAGSGLWRWIAAIGLPLLAAALWGVFRVPGDGGKPVVKTPGSARLVLEAVFFGSAVLALWGAGRSLTALVFGLVVLAHYAASYDRIVWLLKQR